MRSETWRDFDFWLLGVVLLLSIFGVAMIRSAIAGNQELEQYVTRQIIYVGIGLAVIILTTLLDYHFWATLSQPFYFLTMFLLAVVFVMGKVSFGAQRWLDTGLVLIQPAELAKIAIILVLAGYFSKNKDQPHDLLWIGKSLLITGGIVVWILLQPNLSTSIVVLVIWLAMLWISGLPIKYILILGGVIILLAGVTFPFLQDYQKYRVISFLFPDPNESYGNNYNVEQAIVTIGSGGWFGMGYGHGSQVQLRFLKVRHTDFIFAAMAEEFGFIGTVIILILLVFVIYRCLRVANLAGDTYGALIAYGFAILIFFQTIVNVGVNLRIIPVTGLPLPFISYGGSSILSLLLGIGLVESVVLRRKNLEFKG